MMNRIRIAGCSQLQAAHKLLPPLLSAWCRDWCLQETAEPLAADIKVASDRAPQEQLQQAHWLAFSADQGSVLLGTDGLGAWRELLFGAMVADVPDDAVAQSLIQQAQDDLGARLARVLNVAMLRAADAKAITPYRRGSGWLSVRAEINGAVLELLVELRLLDGYLPKGRDGATPAALARREEAIGNVPVKLVVRLPLAEVPIERLQGLQVGDILRGEVTLDTPFQLQTERDALVGRGYWGRQNDRQAIQLTQ